MAPKGVHGLTSPCRAEAFCRCDEVKALWTAGSWFIHAGPAEPPGPQKSEAGGSAGSGVAGPLAVMAREGHVPGAQAPPDPGKVGRQALRKELLTSGRSEQICGTSLQQTSGASTTPRCLPPNLMH